MRLSQTADEQTLINLLSGKAAPSQTYRRLAKQAFLCEI